MNNFIEINGCRIGPGYSTYVVAELSANHDQNFNEAVKTIEAANKAGAEQEAAHQDATWGHGITGI